MDEKPQRQRTRRRPSVRCERCGAARADKRRPPPHRNFGVFSGTMQCPYCPLEIFRYGPTWWVGEDGFAAATEHYTFPKLSGLAEEAGAAWPP
jgi:hypothetical protein